MCIQKQSLEKLGNQGQNQKTFVLKAFGLN